MGKAIVEGLEPRRMLAAGQLDPFFGTGGTAAVSFADKAHAGFVTGLPGGKVLTAGRLGTVAV